jgi:hypothetical protein
LVEKTKEPEMLERREPSEEGIARRAHELDLQRGGAQGKEVEDWVGAEKDLSDKSVVRPLTSAAFYAELRYAWPE